MGFPARRTFSVVAGSVLFAGALLEAQSSPSNVEADGALSSTMGAGVAANPSAPSPWAAGPTPEPRTLASMARELEPVAKVLNGVLDQYRKSGNRDGQANTLCALGNSYNALGHQQKAIEQFQYALVIYREAGDRKNEANVLLDLGDVYRNWGFPDIAVRFYREALQVHAQIHDQPGKAVVLNNLGVTYFSLSNKNKALDYLSQALAAYHDAGDRHAETLTLINIGAAETFLAHNFPRAITLFEEAINELEPLNDRTNEADAFEFLGVIRAGLHQHETAEMNLRRALELYRGLGDAKGEASVLRNLKNLDESHDQASAR